MLKLKDVSKYYQQKLVIDKINYCFDEQRYCIVGANGSGKTTLLMLAAGLETVTTGQITLDEQEVGFAVTKRKLGVSSDKIILPDFLTPKQLLEFHCAQHGCVFPTDLIQSLNFSEQLTTKVSALSLGNCKKISLLLALAHQSKCLLLDEPTTGLDHDSRIFLLDYLNGYQGQIIVTTHEDIFIDNPSYQQLDLSQLNQSFSNVND